MTPAVVRLGLPLVGGAIPITMESLRSFGWDTDDIRDLRGIDQKEVVVLIAHETYEGKTRAKVKGVFPPNAPTVSPIAGDEAARIAAELRGYALQSRQGRPQAAAHAPATAATSTPMVQAMDLKDGDVPFALLVSAGLALGAFASALGGFVA